MNQKTIIISAVVILVLIGAIFYSTGFFSSAENEFDLPCDDENLQMKSKIDLSLLFADGSKKTVTGSLGEPLTVEYDGVEVTSVDWVMSVAASTPTGADAYDNVRVTLTPTSLNEYSGSASEDFSLYMECYPADDSSNPIWTDTSSPPAGHVKFVMPNGAYNILTSETVSMDDVFTSSDDGGLYVFRFSVDGYGCYQGTSTSGDGEWNDVYLPNEGMTSTYSLNYINMDVTVDWDATVEWN